MHSSLNRLNHLSSLATTYVLVLLGLISLASYYTLPPVQIGRVDINDIIIQKGRLRRWTAQTEEIASLNFDIRVDLQPLLNSYNTKQLYLHLNAEYDEAVVNERHDVVVWDSIITRGDMRDFRAVGKKLSTGKGKRRRGNIRVENAKIDDKRMWKQPSGTFKNVQSANFTLHYSLMPYVGLLSTGVAATASGPVTIPEVIKR